MIAPTGRPVAGHDSVRGPARRLISIVFADLVGSTALAERLDPEAMHDLLDRYTDRCGGVIERHGGTVEGFIGDAVVGFFGQDEVHEDDALRAVRAAHDMREACAELSAEFERERGIRLAVKLGVESGQVFVGGSTRRARFAAGDPLNVAARLEQHAPAGEILLGERVQRLVRDAVRMEPVAPLRLKGKGAPVPAWRLLGLVAHGEAIPRSPSSPFVGRRNELAALRSAFARTREHSCCTTVTLLGPAGQGKSRLAREFVGELGAGATVAVGRCPSYGDGVTYRPLGEIVGQLGDGDPRGWLAERLGPEDPAARVLLTAIGLGEGITQVEETFWAVRRTLERAAEERPLVVVVEDLHWAQPTLLDLLEHLAAHLRGKPVLLLCLARPELLDARPGWAERDGGSVIELDALEPGEAREVVTNAGATDLPAATAERIVQLGEGNPLFLEHLAAVGAQTGEAGLPSSIQAVLAARIDRLPPRERSLLERASVQGRTFHREAVEALLPADERTAAPAVLGTLVASGLIRPERSEPADHDAFRFAHVLIREAAYRSLPKQLRAALHERVAGWLETQRDAHDQALGYHLGEAYRHLADLGDHGVHARELATAAARRLTAAAESALLHGDPDGGARLLERARSLLADADGGGGATAGDELLPTLGSALFEAGRAADAAHLLDEAIARVASGRVRARAQVERELVRFEVQPELGSAQGREVVEAVLPVLDREGDGYGQCRAWLLRGQLAWSEGRVSAAGEAWEQAATCARRTGGRRELFDVVGWLAMAAVFGPMPAGEAIERCERLRDQVAGSPIATASTLNPLALAHAMRGEFEAAERFLREAGGILREIAGLGSAVSHLEAFVRLLADQPALAEAPLRADMEALSAMGAGGALATTTALLAQAVHAQGRDEEAAELCRAAAACAGTDDIVTQAIWRGVRARILSREGRCREAEQLARQAVALVEPTDLLLHRGDAMLDLAEVLTRCDIEQAQDAARAALRFHEHKGNAVGATRARRLLAQPTGGR